MLGPRERGAEGGWVGRACCRADRGPAVLCMDRGRTSARHLTRPYHRPRLLQTIFKKKKTIFKAMAA